MLCKCIKKMSTLLNQETMSFGGYKVQKNDVVVKDVIIKPIVTTAQTHQSTTVVEFNVPYADRSFGGLDLMCMETTYTNGHATAARPITFEGMVGSQGSIQKIEVKYATSSEFTNISDPAVLGAIKNAENVNRDWYDLQGADFMGTGYTNYLGEVIASESKTSRKRIYFPSSGVCSKNFPLFVKGGIDFRITLTDAHVCFKCNANILNTDVTIKDTLIRYKSYQLNDTDFKGFMAAHNSRYTIATTEWMSRSQNILATTTDAVIQLNWSLGSVKNIYMCLRDSAMVSNLELLSQTSRAKGQIQKYYLYYDNSTYEGFSTDLNPYTVDAGGVLAGFGKIIDTSEGPYGDADVSMSLAEYVRENPAGTSANQAECGFFFIKFDLSNKLTNGEIATSGLRFDGNNAEVRITKTSDAINYIVNTFVEYDVEYITDGQTWEVNKSFPESDPRNQN